MLNVNELKKYKTIKREMAQAPFDLERFTRKDFKRYFNGKYLTSIKTLEELKIVNVIDKEKVEIELQEPIKKYYINGVEIKDNFYIERLSNQLSQEEMQQMNITTKESYKIETERFYYQYNESALNNYLKDILKGARKELNKKALELKNELEKVENELKLLD